MENKNEDKKKSKKRLKQDSIAYRKHREKAYARKSKFLDKMTPEQREMKRLKDREYYQRKKAENKVKTVSDMTERQKRKQRKSWRKNSQKYKEKKIETISFATVSDNLDHQAHAVWGPMKSALQKILSVRPHYRNRTNIYLWIKTLIEQFPQITASTWTFSEPGHGKGPMDGMGGVLKKTADDQVLRGNDVNTAADFVHAIKTIIPEEIDAIPGIINETKIVWKKTSDVIILLYQFSKLLREIKLQAFSVEDRDKESPVPEMLYLDIKKNDKFLNYLHMSRKSIYDAVYGSDSSDDENLQKVSDRLDGKSDDNCAGLSYGNDKENFHPNMIHPKTFLLVNVPTEN
ncbi:hypothetical protein WA026_009296 [Henosepilachna vigintioctopunctata]|uniref:Uncharacterized protein n=1 Tax=Henosepilachna vigintioctopunctata TaxID=420089 RepID=A0AAW1UNH7_9CUCU